MTSLLQLQHDLARADTAAEVLAVARGTFAYTLDVTGLFGRDSATFWAAPVMAGAVAADGRDAVAFAPSLPPEPPRPASSRAAGGHRYAAPLGERSPDAVPRERGSAARDVINPDDALGVSRHAEPRPAPTDAPGPEASLTALTSQHRPGRSDALAADVARSLHDAARPVPSARSVSEATDEIGSGDLARLCQALAARLNAEAIHAADAADCAACRQAAVYAAEIAALLPGSGP